MNEDPKDALLKQYESEIKQLKDMLAQFRQGGNHLDMLKELQALRKKQELHDAEMQAITQANNNNMSTLEPPSNREEENASQTSARKASAIEEFSVSELIAQL